MQILEAGYRFDSGTGHIYCLFFLFDRTGRYPAVNARKTKEIDSVDGMHLLSMCFLFKLLVELVDFQPL
jgi:hypothetical protein